MLCGEETGGGPASGTPRASSPLLDPVVLRRVRLMVPDGGSVVAVGSAYVTGKSASANFPTTPGAFDTTYDVGNDAFVAKLDPAGAALAYSTYLGGPGNEQGYGIALDAAGGIYVTGWTLGGGFPTTAGAFDTASNLDDAFVTKFVEPVLPPSNTPTPTETPTATATPTPTATPTATSTDTPVPAAGKVTGGGRVNVAGGEANFGLVAQRKVAGGPIKGHLQYLNHATGVQIESVVITALNVSATTATFSGTCTKKVSGSTTACTFSVTAVDNGEPGVHDSFQVSVDGGAPEGGTLTGGNIQVH